MTDGGDIPQIQYAQLVIAALKRVGITETWYVPEEFQAGFYNGKGDTEINLMPTYQEYCRADADDRMAIVERHAGIAADMDVNPETWEQAAPLLRVVLRSADYNIGGTSVSRPAMPFLREFLVLDRPTSMAYLSHDSLSDWGVDAETAFAVARANLEASRGSAQQVDIGEQKLTVYQRPGEEYLASLLLLPGWLADLVYPDGHRPVVAIPDKETLLVAADVPDLIAELAGIAEEAYNDAVRSISPQLYTLDHSGAVVPYPVHDGHPAAEAVRRAGSLLAFHTYQPQKEWLDETHEEQGVDIFVASLLGMETTDGAIRTVATWTEGIHALLPQADLIALQSQDLDADPYLVAWNDVAELVDLRPLPDLDPPRYEVSGWPDPTTMARLRIRARRH